MSLLEEEILNQHDDLFLVDVTHKGNIGNSRLQILVDGDNGLDIDRCAMISRQLGAQLEEMDIIPGKYTLEVSSPGVDHPLKLKRQYAKNVGRTLKVVLTDERVFEGTLARFEGDQIELEITKDKNVRFETIALSEVMKSKVVVSFK